MSTVLHAGDPGMMMMLDEQSFASIEGLLETQTQRSGDISKCSGGRRSRKERSSIKAQKSKESFRKAITPHVLCQLTSQNPSSMARLMPGSEAISLELNIKGMNKPLNAVDMDHSEEIIT